MRWPEKRRAWAWQQLRLVHAAAAAALRSHNRDTINPERLLDAIVELVTFEGPNRDAELAAWKQEHVVSRARCARRTR